MILLITPSYIRFLEEENPFLPELLSKIFPRPKLESNFDVVAAVVDYISFPSDVKPLPNVIQGYGDRVGFEGISVAVSYSDMAAPDLWSQGNDEKASGEKAAAQQSVLFFRFPCESYFGTVVGPILSKILRVVQIPVANTLFHNGQLSTMSASRWVSLPNSTEPQKAYVRTRKKDLVCQTINMAGIFSETDLNLPHKLSLGLEPITSPRIVSASLGNIVRRLYISRNSKETMPASAELEKAIARKIESSPKANSRPAVWALITPSENYADELQMEMTDAADGIESGSRLYRVLSGGGGWGSKMGLLALDPETDFNSPELETSQISESDQLENRTQGDAFNRIIKIGDTVTFFIARESEKSLLHGTAGSPAPSRRSLSLSPSPSVCFGSAPSSLEILADQNIATSMEPPLFDRILINKHFGMLSNQGMVFHVEKEVPTNDIGQSGTVVHTKIDVPGAYFAFPDRAIKYLHPRSRHGIRDGHHEKVTLKTSTEELNAEKSDLKF